MASSTATGVNVLRWGALVFGIFYGFSHQQAISSRDKSAALQHQHDRKQKLIDQAKAEFARKNAPAGSGGAGAATLDPASANFDLETYLTHAQPQSP